MTYLILTAIAVMWTLISANSDNEIVGAIYLLIGNLWMVQLFKFRDTD